MIQQTFNAMVMIMLAKFMLNDIPHAAGLYSGFDPAKYNNIETLFRGVEDLTYGDALKWVKFWYPPTMSKRGIRLTTTTLWTLYSMWREDLVRVEGDDVIMR